MATDEPEWQRWFEDVWRQREEDVYRKLFGFILPEIHKPPDWLFHQLGQETIDPRWQTTGVVVSPGRADRPDWIYATSGLSNPWGVPPSGADPSGASGLGFEFFIQTGEPAHWPIGILNWLAAVQTLAACGLLAGRLLEPMDRIPLGRTIDGTPDCLLCHLLIAPADDFPSRFALASGQVDLLACIGITDAEMRFARAQHSAGLVKLLKHSGCFPRTEARRPSAL
jgi:hypothetical protein